MERDANLHLFFIFGAKNNIYGICINVMKIYPAQISFQAKYISTIKVEKKDESTQEYLPEKVSFIKFDKNNRRDMDALADLYGEWKTATFIDRLIITGRRIQSRFPYYGKTSLYALTTQKKDFDNLNGSEILGLAKVNKTGIRRAYLDIIQVKPDNEDYDKVGTGILNALKEMNDKITLNSVEGVEKFYVINDFEKTDLSTREYVWTRPLAERIKRFFT